MQSPFPQSAPEKSRHAGAQKSRPKPSLLPAFEPSSSSPILPRSLKRRYDGSPCLERPRPNAYPTPVPTSSTGIIPSSPPVQSLTRPILNRSVSALSERVPLGAVPVAELPPNGEPLLLGRSSNASHYQLSSNRLISRIHVRALYEATKGRNGCGQVFLECLGWNGVTIHCQGKTYELRKGDTFSSDNPNADIMLDVQDARVVLKWPATRTPSSLSVSPKAEWDEDDSPPLRARSIPHFGSSPPQSLGHLQSPISPSPRDRTSFLAPFPASSPLRPTVEIFEDDPSDENDENRPPPTSASESAQPTQINNPLQNFRPNFLTQGSSSLSDLDDLSDNDEENDPIIHSFGPFGDNLQSRLAAIATGSPQHARRPSVNENISPAATKPQSTPSSLLKREPLPASTVNLSPIRNHVINQLAFSRLHSLPLSTILSNLPLTLRAANEIGSTTTPPPTFTPDNLQALLDNIPCIGEITREGRDAAGKPLQNEYYYVPENDEDEMRRSAVQQKPGLRAVRKQHKQYYWKRPRF